MVIGTDQGERMEGSFVETALTNEQITEAIEAERKLGWRIGECAFLGPGPVLVDQCVLSSEVANNERPIIRALFCGRRLGV